MKSFKWRAAMTVVTTAILLQTGFGAVSSKQPQSVHPKASGATRHDTAVNSAKTEAPVDGDFAAVVGRSVTAVVTIASSTRLIFGGDFTEQPEGPRQARVRCLGSGVIVSADGYIVTSNHVIQRASDIRVFLSDNRELTAEVVGTDPKTDIAVLKIPAVNLPVLPLGNSSSVHVGELAFAIGDPFGLRQTVTMGIISGKGRTGLGILHYEDFIQTDAAISPGSSGGALINVRGELIGIITAGNREYGGLGFAVPVDMVHSVMDEILIHGRVIRAWLGATIQPLTEATARAFGLTQQSGGALVADVAFGGPASGAGFQAGDIILEVDGKPLRDDRDLDLTIGAKTPGTMVRLTAYREGSQRDFTVMLVAEPAEDASGQHERVPRFSGPLGLSVQTITTEVSESLNLRRGTHGVLVTDVESPSRAAAAAVMEGDIIVEINRQSVRNAEEFHDFVRASNNKPVLLLIERAGTRMFVVVE